MVRGGGDGMRVARKTYPPAPSLFASANHFVELGPLKRRRPRAVAAYVAVLQQLAQWSRIDPAGLVEKPVREYFLHLLNERSYAPQSMRLTRAVSGVPKPTPYHTLGHCYATHLLAAGVRACLKIPELAA